MTKAWLFLFAMKPMVRLWRLAAAIIPERRLELLTPGSRVQKLEQAGVEVLLVDARGVKHVPGRKSDVSDCQWLQELHTYGLLRGAFRPEDQVCVLRSSLRQRSMLVAMASRAVQHRQKALEQMHLKLT